MRPTDARQWIMLITAVGFVLTTWLLIFVAVPPANKDLLLIMIGALGGGFSAAAGLKPAENKPAEPKP